MVTVADMAVDMVVVMDTDTTDATTAMMTATTATTMTVMTVTMAADATKVATSKCASIIER